MSCFHNQSTSSQKLQAHPPRRPEEADEVGRVIQFQMSERERLFDKLMTYPKVDEAHSNAPYGALITSTIVHILVTAGQSYSCTTFWDCPYEPSFALHATVQSLCFGLSSVASYS